MSDNSGGDNGHSRSEDTVAAVLRLTGLAAEVEKVKTTSAQRFGELARSLEAAREQINGLRDDLGSLGGRADEIERQLGQVGALLKQISEQVEVLATQPAKPQQEGYQVNPTPPWWKPADDRCQDAAARLADWVEEVYRPIFGYLASLLAPCWPRHPLCLAYLDTLHEAWCLLYLSDRDPQMVFAQLDWLTRPLLQATEVLAAETRKCRDQGRHYQPGQTNASVTAWANGHR
jgi:hypothetical protein